MTLTQKDQEFLEKLKQLLESKDLSVELKPDQPSYLVLRGNYGEKIHQTFRMSRQGVRWRFHHLFDGYIRAFEAILAVEKSFGPGLREHAIRISRERYQLYQEALLTGFRNADELPRKSNPAQPEERWP
ncbi:MAG: hypothetical protein WCI73_13030 [Phycisphaerae bacterium]